MMWWVRASRRGACALTETSEAARLRPLVTGELRENGLVSASAIEEVQCLPSNAYSAPAAGQPSTQLAGANSFAPIVELA